MSLRDRKFALVGALFIGACASSPKPAPGPVSAGSPGPAASARALPAGGKQALVFIEEIAAEPFREDDEFRAKESVLTEWLTQTPDITVALCAYLLPPSTDTKKPHNAALFGQMMFGQAAYLLEHPGTPSEDEAVFTAGLSAAIRAYRKLLILHPEARQADWDQLDSAERRNDLAPHVKPCLKRQAR